MINSESLFTQIKVNIKKKKKKSILYKKKIIKKNIIIKSEDKKWKKNLFLNFEKKIFFIN